MISNNQSEGDLSAVHKKNNKSLQSKSILDQNNIDAQSPDNLNAIKPNLRENQLPSKKQKTLNLKNITDGRIQINIDEKDKVLEYYVYDYKDSPYDLLEQNPIRVTSYIEGILYFFSNEMKYNNY